MTITSMGTLNIPGMITSKHNAAKKEACRIGRSEKRLKMPFGQASHPKKEPDGARRITADLHTVSPTLIFRWTYTLTGKNIPHILLPAKSNTLSKKYEAEQLQHGR
jgi:hypothetical protein